MARVKRGVTKHARHKKVLSAAKKEQEVDRKIPSEPLCKELKKICNMHIGTEEIRKENLESFG